MSYNVTVKGGKSVRLPTEGKYCEQDIIITAEGGGTEDLEAVLTEQEALIDELKDVLKGKASGGTDVDDAKSIVERTIITYSNKEVKTVGMRAFSHCASLVSVNLPEVTTIGQHGFNSCSALERVEFPKLTALLPGDNFTYCYALKYADLGLVSNLPSWGLANCKILETVILRKENSICTLQATNALSGTPIANGTGYVYVPSALVDSYKTATNWSTYASQIRAIEDYPEICGGET